ncbi:hypothetical protein CPC08DRAFT_728947, partial [Agrocybe pediades]
TEFRYRDQSADFVGPHAPAVSVSDEVKFDEPCMMYRRWREAMKKLCTRVHQTGNFGDGVRTVMASSSSTNYWKKWEENVNEKATVRVNEAAYREITKLLLPAVSSTPAPPVSHPEPIGLQVTAGKHNDDPRQAADNWDIRNFLLNHSAYQFSVQYPYGAEQQLPGNTACSSKRPMPVEFDGGPGFYVSKKRNPRTCYCRQANDLNAIPLVPAPAINLGGYLTRVE